MNRWCLGLVTTLAACTEPNPFASTETSSGTSETESTSMSTTMTTMTTSATTTADTTMGTEPDPDTTDPTSDPTTDPTDETTTDPTGETTGEPVCAAGTHLCIGTIPEGWQGPGALLSSPASDPEPDCEGDFPDVGVVAFADLQATAALCDCECAESLNADCDEVILQADNSAGCGTPIATTLNLGTTCEATPGALQVAANYYWRASAAITEGTCTPQPTEEIDTAVFGERLTHCAVTPQSADGCAAAEQCVPIPGDPYDGRLCIWQAGDLECPDADWTERTLLHQDIADDRDCTACTCGDATGECSGTVNLFNESDCGGALQGAIPVDSTDCTQGLSMLTAFGADVPNAGLTPVDPSCPPSNSDPVGDAEAIAPITVCCLL